MVLNEYLKEEGAFGDWNKLNNKVRYFRPLQSPNEQLHNLCFSPRITEVFKSNKGGRNM
jgi:hypothetical protein